MWIYISYCVIWRLLPVQYVNFYFTVVSCIYHCNFCGCTRFYRYQLYCSRVVDLLLLKRHFSLSLLLWTIYTHEFASLKYDINININMRTVHAHIQSNFLVKMQLSQKQNSSNGGGPRRCRILIIKILKLSFKMNMK